MKKFLITGGLGFVGINLVRHFASQLPDASIIAADILPYDQSMQDFLEPVQKNVKIHYLDVRDRGPVRELINGEQINHVIHAAAITPIPRQEKEEAFLVIDVNLGGAINILNAAVQSNHVSQIILCSSNAVYEPVPTAVGQSIQEEAALSLDNLYAITKYSSEMLGRRIGKLKDRRITAVRFPSVYGPMERPTGSREKMSLLRQLKTAYLEKQKVKLYGEDITRDWTHTEDIARALFGLVNAPEWHYPVYNVGSGTARPISKICSALEKQGLSINWVDDPKNADFIFTARDFRGALDISRIRQDAGYSPQRDPVEDLEKYLKEP